MHCVAGTKEVAERLYAQPGSKASAVVRVQYLQCELICPVPAEDFYPQPKVDSAVVRLRPRQLSRVCLDPHRFEILVKLGFAAKLRAS